MQNSTQSEMKPNTISNGFKSEAEGVIGTLREAFSEVIEAAIDKPPTAKDISDSFGIHRKLGWQIAHVAYDDEPLFAARYVPARKSVQAWLTAARGLKISEHLLLQVEDAIESFERFVNTHAPDRSTLEMMLEASATRSDEAADLRWRKEAFNGNGYIWGVRVRTQLATAILAPSSKEGWFDMARLNGLFGFVRTRPEVRWVIGQSVTLTGEDNKVAIPKRQPISPNDAASLQGVPIVKKFCSTPTPTIMRVPGEFGMTNDELSPGPMGQTGEVDIVTGEILRELAPAYGTYAGEEALFGTGVRTPAEILVCDMFVHHDLFGDVERSIRVYSELFSQMAREKRDELVVADQVTQLGRGLSRLAIADVPRYTQMAKYVFDKADWNPQDFNLYRIRMPYPPIPTSVMFQHELPPAAD